MGTCKTNGNGYLFFLPPPPNLYFQALPQQQGSKKGQAGNVTRPASQLPAPRHQSKIGTLCLLSLFEHPTGIAPTEDGPFETMPAAASATRGVVGKDKGRQAKLNRGL